MLQFTKKNWIFILLSLSKKCIVVLSVDRLHWWINVTESNPVFLGYCKRRLIWILKPWSPKTSISDTHVTRYAHVFWIWTHPHWNLFSAASKHYKGVGCWKHYVMSSGYYRLQALCSWLWFSPLVHFVLISFHNVSQPCDLSCLRFVGDIVSFGAFSRLSRTLLYRW